MKRVRVPKAPQGSPSFYAFLDDVVLNNPHVFGSGPKAIRDSARILSKFLKSPAGADVLLEDAEHALCKQSLEHFATPLIPKLARPLDEAGYFSAILEAESADDVVSPRETE